MLIPGVIGIKCFPPTIPTIRASRSRTPVNQHVCPQMRRRNLVGSTASFIKSQCAGMPLATGNTGTFPSNHHCPRHSSRPRESHELTEHFQRQASLSNPTIPPQRPASGPQHQDGEKGLSGAGRPFAEEHTAPGASARKEPGFTEPGEQAHVPGVDTSMFSHPAYTYNRNDVHRYAGFDYQNVQQPRRRWSRVMLMPAIFVVGACVGLSANWWMKKPAGEPARGNPPAVTSIPMERNEASLPATAGGRKGISASELPYDGKPPPMDEDGAVAAAASSESATTSSGASAGSSGEGAAGGETDDSRTRTADIEERTPAAPAATVTPRQAAAQVREADQKAAVIEADVSSKAAAAKSAARSPEVALVREADRKAAAIDDDTPQKAAAPKRAARDPEIERIRRQAALDRADAIQAEKNREIERIRQQAAEELKKKNENQRAADEARTKAPGRPNVTSASEKRQPAVAGTSKRALLAQCERRSNFILREHCKWEICDGSWGKNGCPSYERQASVF